MTITQTYRDGELVETVNHGGSESQLIGGSAYERSEPAVAMSPVARAVKDIVYENPPKATIDFETRSACSIKDCGSWRYSLDPTTEVMCLAFRLPHWEEGRTALWHPAFQIGRASCRERV